MDECPRNDKIDSIGYGIFWRYAAAAAAAAAAMSFMTPMLCAAKRDRWVGLVISRDSSTLSDERSLKCLVFVAAVRRAPHNDGGMWNKWNANGWSVVSTLLILLHRVTRK